jgi:hypothetical protein
MTDTLSAAALICTLNPSPAVSSSELIASHVLDALREHDVARTAIRVVDHDAHRNPDLARPAMSGTDYKDLAEVPDAVRSTITTVARPAAHAARLLKDSNYPPPS